MILLIMQDSNIHRGLWLLDQPLTIYQPTIPKFLKIVDNNLIVIASCSFHYISSQHFSQYLNIMFLHVNLIE